MATPIVGTSGRASAILSERSRQQAAADTNYLRNGLYFFEITVPNEGVELTSGSPDSATTSGGKTSSFLLPLILNPETISIEDKFTTHKHYTARGGYYVEEAGIVERILIIRGHTGVKPRAPRAREVMPAVETKVENPSFTARPDRGYAGPLSGQKHFHFLQDKIFRTYADLKRTPEFAKDTELVFHMPKDNEHWRIIPERFVMTRDIRRKMLYQYEIVATIVGPAEATSVAEPKEDKTVFDAINDVTQTIRGGLALAQAAIEDVNAYVNDATQAVSGFLGTFQTAAGLVAAVEQSLDGVTRGVVKIVGVPLSAVQSLITNTESLVQSVVDVPDEIRDTLKQGIHNIGDAASQFAIHTGAYESDPRRDLAEGLTNRSLGEFGATAAELEAAAANPPTSLQRAARRDAELSPGDQIRAQQRTYPRPRVPDFRSARVRQVQAGDSLSVLAARYLGDSRRWREIAVLNDLRYPYVSESGLPNTVGVGDDILVPSEEPPVRTRSAAGVLGVPLEAPAPERALGRDMALVETAPGVFDFAIDEASGGLDFLTRGGLENLEQAIVTRLTTERGSDVLFRELGYKRVVGLAFPDIDREMLRLRLGEAVLEDPRVTAVRRVEILPSEADTVRAEVEADVLDIDQPVRLFVPTTASTTGTP